MIINEAPAKMALFNIVTGYKLAYIQHSIYTDYDVYGKSFWITRGSNSTTRQDFTDVSKFFVVLNTLLPSTQYSVRGAFLDAIIDTQLRDAQIGFNLSDIVNITTKTAPRIISAYSTAEMVDVGVGTPIVNISLVGQADFVTIELKSLDTPGDWFIAYRGALLTTVQFGGIPVGSYSVRVSGQVTLPDGVTVDSSGVAEFEEPLTVTYNFEPPSAPTDVIFKVAQIQDGKERYDLRLEWDWARLVGANVREFLITYVDSESYASTGWSKAQKINVGSAKAGTISSFPWKIEHKFKVSAIAWGPDSQSITESSVYTFILNESTELDNSFVNETGIEVNYAFIKGKLNVDGDWQQTFLIDAATGAINIGLLDSEGRAPISFDPTNRVVNVDGKIITKQINSASFVLTNLTGQDNPALYTQGKYYGDLNSGVWIGMDNTTAKPKVDIGNGTQYIRYDGDTLKISGDVVIGTPNGDVSLEEGMQGRQTVFIYKLGTSLPAKPTTQDYPPETWFTTPPLRTDMTQNIYASTGLLDPVTNKLVSGTSWSDVIQWSGTEGSIGTDGTRGPGFYAQAIVNLTAFDNSQATAFFTNNFGSAPVKYDVITQYNSTTPSTAFTRQWDGSVWGTPALILHGDMVVNGSITAQKLIADYAFLAQLGVDTIYNRAAALSSDPETIYTMKIDLANSYIHIR